MPKLSISIALILVAVLTGCRNDPFVPAFPVSQVEGYRPLYASPETLAEGIKLQPPRALLRPGKIYSVAQYLLINEENYGIHVYDNTNPAAPVSKGFLAIPGNTDVAVKGTTLYANNLTDLIALDISDWSSIKEISRTHQNYWSTALPPKSGTYFECVDSTKGAVVGWEHATLQNPKCYR